MSIRNLAEVRTRLDEAVASLPGEPADSAELYDRLEMVATQILDSEHTDYEPPGALQELLMSYLYVRQIELGLLPFPDPREQ
jgi:hypothetical protein